MRLLWVITRLFGIYNICRETCRHIKKNYESKDIGKKILDNESVIHLLLFILTD